MTPAFLVEWPCQESFYHVQFFHGKGILFPSFDPLEEEGDRIRRFMLFLEPSGVGAIINRYVKNGSGRGGRPSVNYHRLFAAEDFAAIAVYSDIARTGFFESSNALLNKFVEATVWSAKGNFADIPTDYLTRERHGWTGDAQIFFDSAGYLFDFATFSQKYLRDMYDWQKKNGRLPQIAPAGGVDFYMAVMNGSVGWADAGVLIPYRFWKLYGDEDILRQFYPGMKKYAGFMISRVANGAVPTQSPWASKARRKSIWSTGDKAMANGQNQQNFTK